MDACMPGTMLSHAECQLFPQHHRPIVPTRSVEEDHGKPIFCIAFNFADPAHNDILASVGLNRVGGSTPLAYYSIPTSTVWGLCSLVPVQGSGSSCAHLIADALEKQASVQAHLAMAQKAH